MCSVFFTDRVVSERGSGQEIISGTPLKMPNSAEFESFRKIVSQVWMMLYASLSQPISVCLPLLHLPSFLLSPVVVLCVCALSMLLF